MGASERKKWLFALFTALFISFLLFLSIISGLSSSPYSSTITAATSPNRGVQTVPSFAYYIYGGAGDKEQIIRLLLAVYHPRNRYLLHLAADASGEEREKLAAEVMSVPAVRAFGNVDVIGKPIWLTDMGATNVAATLRAAAILMKLGGGGGWDWFITLSAHDYPLLSQDDLAHVFSSIKRDVNFIDHTSDLGWKEQARFRPIVVDPSIYLARRSQLFTATEKRPTPISFKVFTGSPWVILSRSFLEYSIFGWDNLPRTILMYFNNAMLPQEGYFHSVACNSPEFSNTTVNNDLRYMIWDSPPKMNPHYLGVSDYDQMIQSGAAFARRFQKDDPVLTVIDERILRRRHNRVAPGAWCAGRDSWFTDPCAQLGDISSIKPGLRAKRFSESMTNYLDDLNSQSTQCK